MDTIMHKALLLKIPPRYHELVAPYPIYMSEAVFSELSLRDLQVPSIPLMRISLGTRMVSFVAMGNANNPSSSAW